MQIHNVKEPGNLDMDESVDTRTPDSSVNKLYLISKAIHDKSDYYQTIK